MTLTEFNATFDIIYNNLFSNQAPGLDEYEKSVFLTNAQLEIVKNYFNPLGNKYQEGYDGSPKRQTDFSTITELAVYTPTDAIVPAIKLNQDSIVFPYNNDFLYLVQELATVTDSITNTPKNVNVKGISNVDYMLQMTKPYKYPTKQEAWRIINNSANRQLELLLSFGDELLSYVVRYVRRPSPIILKDLTTLGLTVDGVSIATDCTLDESLHQEIVQRAAEMAKMSFDSQNIKETVVTAGQRTE